MIPLSIIPMYIICFSLAESSLSKTFLPTKSPNTHPIKPTAEKHKISHVIMPFTALVIVEYILDMQKTN